MGGGFLFQQGKKGINAYAKQLSAIHKDRCTQRPTPLLSICELHLKLVNANFSKPLYLKK